MGYGVAPAVAESVRGEALADRTSPVSMGGFAPLTPILETLLAV
jgi:hypothetical protein